MCFVPQELLSVLFAPVILCFSMPSCAQDIVDFVAEHTVDVEGVGSVCSYSLFDFGRFVHFSVSYVCFVFLNCT